MKAAYTKVETAEVSGDTMKNSLNKKQIGLAISCILVMGVVSSAVNAEGKLIAREYVTDEWETAFTSDFGECWHTGTALPLLKNSVPCKASFAAMEVPLTPTPAPVPKASVMNFEVDALFDYNKSELRPSVRLELDTFIAKINEMNPESITVTGHTDRLGSDSYNQELSESRAQSVKDYMISMGIPTESIYALGKGETEPVTKSDDCKDNRMDQLIVCLQPNRRVEAQVVGTYK
jgi:OmpA-OmpF porin, OOP family